MKNKVGLGMTLVMVIFSMVIAGCGTNTQATETNLEGSSWVLQRLPGQELVPDSEITLNFEADQIQGSAGCNNYFGGTNLDGTPLAFGPIANTEMFCEGLMDQELAYLSALSEATAIQVEGKTLTLLDGAGEVLAEFVAVEN